jgi:serine/threonine protein kinase
VGAAKAGAIFGKYQLTRLLGQGGMGEVYEAHDTSKDRTVALKILPEELSRDEGGSVPAFNESRVLRRCWRSRTSARLTTG